jgi:integrase
MKMRSKTSPGRVGINLLDAMSGLDERASQAQDLTFAELCNAYIATGRFRNGDLQLRKWIDAFGDRPAWGGISTDELDLAGQAMLKANYKPATVNRNISQIGMVYRWAKRQRMTPKGFRSPTLDAIRYEEPCRPVEIADSDVRRLIDLSMVARDRRFTALLRLLVDSGARQGEVLYARWKDVDLTQRTILAGKTKTGVPRVLYFTEETARHIQRIWPERIRQPERMLFESRRAPGAVVSYKKAWERIRASAGVTFTMRDLRHYRARKLLEAGASLAVAAQCLGHSSLILHRRYGHLETKALASAVADSWRTS